MSFAAPDITAASPVPQATVPPITHPFWGRIEFERGRVLVVKPGQALSPLGIEAGDVLIRSGDLWLHSATDLARALQNAEQSGVLQFEVSRSGGVFVRKGDYRKILARLSYPEH